MHDEHVITVCGTEKDITPKLMLKATKFSVFLNAHQIVHVTIMQSLCLIIHSINASLLV